MLLAAPLESPLAGSTDWRMAAMKVAKLASKLVDKRGGLRGLRSVDKTDAKMAVHLADWLASKLAGKSVAWLVEM